MDHQPEWADQTSSPDETGHSGRTVTRRRLLAQGAIGAGLAVLGVSEVVRAAESARAANDLHGTLSVCWLNYNSSKTYKQPGIMYKKYQHLHPSVSFTFVPSPIGPANSVAWVNTRALANRLPDIFEPYTVSAIMGSVSRGWWVDLTAYLDKPNPYVPGNKRWRDLFQPGLLEEGKYYDGRNFMVTADTAGFGLWANKQIFHHVGVTYPTTWAELMDVSEKIKKAGFSAFGMTNGDGYQVAELSWLMESQLWSKEFKQPDSTYFMSPREFLVAVKRGKFSKTDARTREAWKLIKQWVPTWYPGSLSTSAPVGYRAFLQGKVAMWLDGTWYLPPFQAALGSNLDFIEFPTVTAASSPYAMGDKSTGFSAFTGGNPVAVASSSERNGNLPLAIDFLQYYSVPSVVSPVATEQGYIPYVKGADPGGELIRKTIEFSLRRPTIFDPASELFPSSYILNQEKLCTGYLSGALDLSSALSQMQNTLANVVDQAITQAGVHI